MPDSLQIVSSKTPRDYDPSPTASDLLDWEADVKPMIEAAIALQMDAGLRGESELYALRRGDIVDTPEALRVVVDGKTSEREVALVPSTPYVPRWLEAHPSDDPTAPLWCKPSTPVNVGLVARKSYLRCRPSGIMSQANRQEITATVDRLIEDVGSWPGVTVDDHRFGGTEWRVGPREIGHVHAWGMLDIAYLRALRDALIGEGETGVHHLLDQSGWTTFYIEHPDDYDHARWLVRLSYLYHVNILKKTPAGAEEYATVDVEAELATLAPSDAVRAAFGRRRPGVAGTPEA